MFPAPTLPTLAHTFRGDAVILRAEAGGLVTLSQSPMAPVPPRRTTAPAALTELPAVSISAMRISHR